MSAPIVITPMAFAVNRKGESPVYGESSTLVSVEDEAAGAFVCIQQDSSVEVGKIRLDGDELLAVVTAGRALLAAHERLA